MVNCVAFVSKFEKCTFLPRVMKNGWMDGWVDEYTELMNE